MFKIDGNWREIATKHYSTLALFLIVALILIPEVLYLTLGLDLNPVVMGRWLIAAALFALAGKFLVQSDEGKWVRRAVIGVGVLIALWASVPAMAAPAPSDPSADVSPIVLADPFDRAVVPLIIRWEGKHMRGGWHVAYLDIVGVPTICYGSTRGVRIGMRMTEAQCQVLLAEEIADYRARLNPAFSDDTLARRLPSEREAAFVSLAYNVGVHGASRSTAVRRLNAGKIAPACQALTWWNKAGGRTVRGLVNRRSAEQELCLRGI